jgi:small subunit ribosomal protein S8
MNDIIADLIIRIKNGSLANKLEIFVFKTKYSICLLNLLEEEGFIRGYKISKEKPNYLIVLLKYSENKPVISKFKKVSTKSRRIYISISELWRINKAFGILIISTTKGLMTDKNARRLKLGGEVIAYIE